ncbi:MAG: lytic murein transglycosylase [Proteobacteria bacterium]|nr:lytic murein transglycosylase [Pseudomonadota bacterium]
MLRRTTAIAALAVTCAGCLPAQSQDGLAAARAVAPATTASIPSAGNSAAREWSGEAGASGHPLMTAQSIRAAAANFTQCLEELWPLAQRRGISRASYTAHALPLTADLRIMDLLDSQPEFTKSFWDYLDLLVSEERILRGRELLSEHRGVFDRVERSYGVDRHILAAVWGVETRYGALAGGRPVLRSTATLACVGRRQPYFREEFLSALEIVARGDVAPDQFKGSWAGAFGPTQFMPTTFKRHAVDFDGDGRRDIIASIADAMASTANNFRRDGWAAGQTWGYEVALPANFDFLLADRSRQMTLGDWERMGVRRANREPFAHPGERAFLLVPAGVRGPAFLMLQNFRVIMKYNPAEAYALAIGHLADRLRGGAPFAQDWPREQRVLSLGERAEMQQILARRGFNVGEPDGRLGPKSRAAIRDFQVSAGLIADGFATADLLDRLRRQ